MEKNHHFFAHGKADSYDACFTKVMDWIVKMEKTQDLVQYDITPGLVEFEWYWSVIMVNVKDDEF